MDCLSCLRTAAALSERMLDAARRGDWEALQQLEAEERRQMEQWQTVAPAMSRDAAEQKRLLEAILERHTAILALAIPLHTDLKVLLTGFAEASGNHR